MENEIKNTIIRKIKIGVHLYNFFKDYEKVYLWLTTENFNFGGVSPLHLMSMQREHKVLQFIEAAISENKPLKET